MTRPAPAGLRRSFLLSLPFLGLALGILFSASLVLPARPAPSGAASSVPDTLLLVRHPRAQPFRPTDTRLELFQPAAGAFRPLLEGATQPIPSPDGRDLYVLQQREVADAVRTTVVALAADTLRPRWSADVASRPTADAFKEPYALHVRLAPTRDRVYVATHRWQSPDPITLVALDRVDGFERHRWHVDAGRQTLGNINLVAPPGGADLWLLTSDPGPSGRFNPPPTELLAFRFALPDGRELARHNPLPQTSAQVFSAGRPLPDGRGLYALTWADNSAAVAVHFLDLASGATDRLDLPFRASQRTDFLPYEHGLSHDGQRLYVLAPTLAQLAIVDLPNHRLEQTVSLDTSALAQSEPTASLLARASTLLAGLFVQTAEAKPYFQGGLQLSPDGRRLYAIGATGQGHDARARGVWVIDTASWRITHRWLPDLEPAKLLLSGDGRHLYVQQVNWHDSAEAGRLHALDATTGAELFSTEPLPAATVYSLAELYREQYGRSPGVAGQQPRDAHLPPIASLAVSAAPQALTAGDQVTIEARFVAPDGRTVQPGQPDVRHQPPALLSATLFEGKDSATGTTLPLEPTDHATYRGAAAPVSADPGRSSQWAVEVVAEWPDGARRRAVLPEAFALQPALPGTDGRRYMLRLSSHPAQPVADEPATVLATFADAETGAPLPEGVTLADGLPELLEASFYDHGVTTQRLLPVAHGTYEGQVRLWNTGPWKVWIWFQTPAGPRVDILAGYLHVVRR